jgi:hypothetical protein
MTWDHVAVHVLLAVILFFLMNWMSGLPIIRSHYYHVSYFSQYETAPAFNIVLRVLSPVVYVIIVSATLYAFGLDVYVENIWLVALYHIVLVRWGFNLAYGRRLLLAWRTQLGIAAFSTAIAYVAYRQVLLDRARLLPDPANLANELWIAVLLFIYKLLDQVSPKIQDNTELQQRYFRRSYQRLRRRFGGIVDGELLDQRLHPFAYAVLIYEGFNRPPLVQWFERQLFRFGLAKSLGPMQLQVSEAITDDEIVRRGCLKIVSDYRVCLEETQARYAGSEDGGSQYWESMIHDQALNCTAAKFNIRSDYPGEVAAIHDFLRSEFYGDQAPPIAA